MLVGRAAAGQARQPDDGAAGAHVGRAAGAAHDQRRRFPKRSNDDRDAAAAIRIPTTAIASTQELVAALDRLTPDGSIRSDIHEVIVHDAPARSKLAMARARRSSLVGGAGWLVLLSRGTTSHGVGRARSDLGADRRLREQDRRSGVRRRGRAGAQPRHRRRVVHHRVPAARRAARRRGDQAGVEARRADRAAGGAAREPRPGRSSARSSRRAPAITSPSRASVPAPTAR